MRQSSHWSMRTLKYLGLEIQVSRAIPELVGWMTGDDVIHDDAVAPSAIGWRTQANSSQLANFSLEGWTRLAGVSSCSGASAYGYVVWPWLVNGTFYPWKAENGLTELKLSAQTKKNSPWGVGPYSVNLSKAAATPGHPWPLFEAVTADDHRHFQRTELAPPLTTLNCGPVVGPLVVVDDDAAGAGLAATATLPLPVANTTPGVINWGDATPPAVVAAGALTATHVYLAAGPYTVTYKPSAQSGSYYVGTVTMA
jgi:hypothetical protein